MRRSRRALESYCTRTRRPVAAGWPDAASDETDMTPGTAWSSPATREAESAEDVAAWPARSSRVAVARRAATASPLAPCAAAATSMGDDAEVGAPYRPDAEVVAPAAGSRPGSSPPMSSHAYPRPSTVARSCSDETSPESNSTTALPASRATSTRLTPPSCCSPFSTCEEQDEHVMPRTARVAVRSGRGREEERCCADGGGRVGATLESDRRSTW
jgi:hypothetical protein